MHPDIKLLVDLQAVDLRLTQLRAQLASFPQQLAAVEQRVAQARQQLAASRESLTGSLKARKTFEMDVDSWKEKARKYRDQSAAVKTNEAYKALQHEIQHAEGEMAQAEDRLLDRMVAGEDYERQVKAAEHDVAAVEHDRSVLATALVALASGPARQPALAAAATDTLARMRRLLAPLPPLNLAGRQLARASTFAAVCRRW